MSSLSNTKNKYKVLAAKKIAVDYTVKFENFLSVVIVLLASLGILRTVLQAIS